MQERIFKKFFDVAEIAALSKEEYAKYWESEKIFYDNVGAFMAARAKGIAEGEATGKAEGRAEGRAEGKDEANRENARKMKAKGYKADDIAEITGLTEEEIEAL